MEINVPLVQVDGYVGGDSGAADPAAPAAASSAFRQEFAAGPAIAVRAILSSVACNIRAIVSDKAGTAWHVMYLSTCLQDLHGDAGL